MPKHAKWIWGFVLLTGCASTPKEPVLDVPMTQEVRKEYEGYCAKGNPFSCYKLGAEYDEKKNWGEAKVWFGKACDLKLGAACSEGSVMAKSHLNERDEAIRLARKSCELNDTLGCYNLGCYQCVYQNDPVAAFKSLELAVKIGYRNLESLATDPDLECVRKHKNWNTFLKKIPVEGDGKVTHQYALSTGSRHLYHPKLKFSYAAVPGFHIQYSVSGVMVFDDAGSRIYFTGANQPFSELSAAVKKNEMISPGEKEIHSDLGTVNGYPAYVRVVKGTTQGLEYIASIYVTGDETYTVTAQATYLASYHSTYGSQILSSAESVVLDARGPPDADQLPYTNAAQIGSYRYAGLQSGGPIWTPSGKLPIRGDKKTAWDTLVVNSFIFTKDEPFIDSTFEKVWTMVAGQSGIETEKFDLKKLVKDRAGGNLAWHYLANGEQIDRDAIKHKIQLEVGLVKLPHTVPMGDIGYFWARVIKSPKNSLLVKAIPSDTQALSRLKIRPPILKELKEMPAEEPEVTAPHSTGNGAIPAS